MATPKVWWLRSVYVAVWDCDLCFVDGLQGILMAIYDIYGDIYGDIHGDIYGWFLGLSWANYTWESWDNFAE